MTEFRQCSLCGRKGTRSFIRLADGGPPVCKYPTTCNRRRRAWLNSFKRARPKAAA